MKKFTLLLITSLFVTIVSVITLSAYNITGTISGNGNKGITVKAGNYSATTDLSGFFTITKVPNGNYSLVPSKSGITFSPKTLAVTVKSKDLKEMNFSIDPCYPQQTSSGLPRLLWPLQGLQSSSRTSMAYGADWLTSCGGSLKHHTGRDIKKSSGSSVGLNVYAAYAGQIKAIIWDDTWHRSVTIQHSYNNITFTTNYNHLDNSVSLTNNQNITQGFKIGSVSDMGTNTHLHFTVRIGSYTNIANRGALPVINQNNSCNCNDGKYNDPVFPEYFVNPSNLSYDENCANITGTISGSSKKDVAVTAGSYSATTTSTGSYTIYNVPNGSYTLTPSKSGYIFTPSTTSICVNGKNVTDKNFTMVATYTILGKISGSGNSGVKVSAGFYSATSDKSGVYTIKNVPNGFYTLTPGKTGYHFSPSSMAITVNGANLTGKNFSIRAKESIENPNKISENSVISVYPNPTNSIITIKFNVGNPAIISLNIVNESGENISNLITNSQYTSGEYESIFDTKNLPSGVYYYKLQIDNNIYNGNFIVVK